MAAGAHLNKDFFDLVKAIGESKSKQVRRTHRLPRAVAQRRCDT